MAAELSEPLLEKSAAGEEAAPSVPLWWRRLFALQTEMWWFSDLLGPFSDAVALFFRFNVLTDLVQLVGEPNVMTRGLMACLLWVMGFMAIRATVFNHLGRGNRGRAWTFLLMCLVAFAVFVEGMVLVLLVFLSDPDSLYAGNATNVIAALYCEMARAIITYASLAFFFVQYCRQRCVQKYRKKTALVDV